MNQSRRQNAKPEAHVVATYATGLILLVVVVSMIGNPAFAQKGRPFDNPEQQDMLPGNSSDCAPGGSCAPKDGCAGGGCAKNDSRKEGLSEIREQYLKSSAGRGANDSVEPDWNRFGMNGSDCRTCNGEAVAGHINGARLNAQAYAQVPKFIPKEFVQFDTRTKRLENEIYNNFVQTTGYPLTDTSYQVIGMKMLDTFLAKVSDPERMVPVAQAWGQSQAIGTANAAADMARNQATSAIEYCSSYLHNFTVEPNNKWNKLRDSLFVPIAVLLLLPGAVLSQVRATMSQGSPVMAQVSPFDGLLRSVIAVFAIPATYLVINYGIDLSNSINYTIHSEYKRLFKSDMYEDALAAEVRATPVRKPEENRNAVDLPTVSMKPLLNDKTAFGKFEGANIANKYEDPAAGVYIVPQERADEALSSGVVASRMALMGANAGLTTTWNMLCAFQLAYFYYLWFAGPIAAALWVWPMKPLQNALPSWIEGVVTLSFWSLFWNTVVLLMACFKGVDDTGTLMTTALNFLATASVKYAFDFAGLVKAAGQEAASKAMNGSGKGSQTTGGGAGGGATNQNTAAGTYSGGSTSSPNTSLLAASNSVSGGGALLTSEEGRISSSSTSLPQHLVSDNHAEAGRSLAATGLLGNLTARRGARTNTSPSGVTLPPLSQATLSGSDSAPNKTTAVVAGIDENGVGANHDTSCTESGQPNSGSDRRAFNTDLHQTGQPGSSTNAAIEALIRKTDASSADCENEITEREKAGQEANRLLEEIERNKHIDEILNDGAKQDALKAEEGFSSVTGTIVNASVSDNGRSQVQEKPVHTTDAAAPTINSPHAVTSVPPSDVSEFINHMRRIVGEKASGEAVVDEIAISAAGGLASTARGHSRDAIYNSSTATNVDRTESVAHMSLSRSESHSSPQTTASALPAAAPDNAATGQNRTTYHAPAVVSGQAVVQAAAAPVTNGSAMPIAEQRQPAGRQIQTSAGTEVGVAHVANAPSRELQTAPDTSYSKRAASAQANIYAHPPAQAISQSQVNSSSSHMHVSTFQPSSLEQLHVQAANSSKALMSDVPAPPLLHSNPSALLQRSSAVEQSAQGASCVVSPLPRQADSSGAPGAQSDKRYSLEQSRTSQIETLSQEGEHYHKYASAAVPGTVEYLSSVPQSNAPRATEPSERWQRLADSAVQEQKRQALQPYPVPLPLTAYRQDRNAPNQVSPPPISTGANAVKSAGALQTTNQNRCVGSDDDRVRVRKAYDLIDFGSEDEASSGFNPPASSGALSPTHPPGVSPPPAKTFGSVLGGVNNARKI